MDEQQNPEMNPENKIEPVYLSPRDYLDEDYEPETGMYYFIFQSYTGNFYRLGLKKSDIERFNLFMLKEVANQKYFNHIWQTNP